MPLRLQTRVASYASVSNIYGTNGIKQKVKMRNKHFSRTA